MHGSGSRVWRKVGGAGRAWEVGTRRGMGTWALEERQADDARVTEADECKMKME